MILVVMFGYLGCGDSEPKNGVFNTTQNDEKPIDNEKTESVDDTAPGQQKPSSHSTPLGAENQQSADNNGQSMPTETD